MHLVVFHAKKENQIDLAGFIKKFHKIVLGQLRLDHVNLTSQF